MLSGITSPQETKKIIKMEEDRDHKIKVKLTTGEEVEGKCICFTPPFDNEPEIADFLIKREQYSGVVCITEPEIDTITIIE